MVEKIARGPIKIRKDQNNYFVEYGLGKEGPLMATQVAEIVLDKIRGHPDPTIVGPTHSLGRYQTTDLYKTPPFVVLNYRGEPVDTGYSIKSLFNKNLGRLLGWKRGSGKGVISMSRRQRRTWGAKDAARNPSGLYGYTKKTQSDCETAVRKINRRATALIRTAYRKDERVLSFLQTHAKRASSNPARVLLAAWKNLGKRASEIEGGKVAMGRSYSLYGYPSKTVKVGLALCSQLREETGSVAAELHARRIARYTKITGFLRDHGKQARCYTSRMLLAGYPDESANYALRIKAANLDGVGEGQVGDWFTRGGCESDCGCGGKAGEAPQSVDDWLSWDMNELEAS